MRHALVHDYYIKENQVRYVIEDDLGPLLEQVNRYLAEVNWEEWEKNEVVIKETAVHKSLVQTAQRMKKDGIPVNQIYQYTSPQISVPYCKIKHAYF